MAAIGNIVINDGQAAPVAHTFFPVTSGPKTLWRENISNLNILGQGTISLDYVHKAELHKLRLALRLPALEVVTGSNSSGYSAAPKVAYINTFSADIILPSRSTAAQRKDLRVLLSNLLLNAIVADQIDNLNVPY